MIAAVLHHGTHRLGLKNNPSKKDSIRQTVPPISMMQVVQNIKGTGASDYSTGVHLL